jgi:hypothetical protein
MQRQAQAQQGQGRSQARQVPQQHRRPQSGQSTPAASPSHRQVPQMPMPIYQNGLPLNFPQHPGGPSRDNSVYGNNALSSISTTPNPMTPIESSFSSSAGRSFNAASFGNSFTNSFGSSPYMTSGNGSTTPIEPPPGWGVSPVQANDAFNWAHMPPQFPSSQQSQLGNDMPDMLDPQVFNSLAELLDQSSNGIDLQQQLQQQQQQESFDLLAALTQVQSQNQNQQTHPHQVGSQNGNSASLLTRRMQQPQPQPPHQYSRPGSIGGSTHGTPNSSTPQYPSPSFTNYPQNTAASLGQLPTPPQSFSGMFGQVPSQGQKASSTPTTPWPLPDRQGSYTSTPVTTPGGGEFSYTSPVDVSVHYAETREKLIIRTFLAHPARLYQSSLVDEKRLFPPRQRSTNPLVRLAASDHPTSRKARYAPDRKSPSASSLFPRACPAGLDNLRLRKPLAYRHRIYLRFHQALISHN